LHELEHPRKPELEAVRQLILGVSAAIREGIKWNSPSFRTADWFATTNLQGRDKLRLVLHAGAKIKESATTGLKIGDPTGLLQWLAKDRCLVTIGDSKDFFAKRVALRNVILEWIGQL
jgi:hypothetical protein